MLESLEEKIEEVVDKLDGIGYCYYMEEYPFVTFDSLEILNEFKKRVAASRIVKRKKVSGEVVFRYIPSEYSMS